MITALAAGRRRPRSGRALVLGCRGHRLLRPGRAGRHRRPAGAAVAVRNPATARAAAGGGRPAGLAVRLIPFGERCPASAAPAAAHIHRPGRRRRHLRGTDRVGRARSPRRPRRRVSPLADPAGGRGPAGAARPRRGFELLLHQAAGQVELMTGRRAPVAAMRAAGLAALADGGSRGRHSGANAALVAAREYQRGPACVTVVGRPCSARAGRRGALAAQCQLADAGHASGGPPRPPPT